MHDLTAVYEGLAKLRKVIDKMEVDLKEAAETDNYFLMAKAFVLGNVRFDIAEQRCKSSGEMAVSLLNDKQREEFAMWLLDKIQEENNETPQEQEQPETNSVTP